MPERRNAAFGMRWTRMHCIQNERCNYQYAAQRNGELKQKNRAKYKMSLSQSVEGLPNNAILVAHFCAAGTSPKGVVRSSAVWPTVRNSLLLSWHFFIECNLSSSRESCQTETFGRNLWKMKLLWDRREVLQKNQFEEHLGGFIDDSSSHSSMVF